MSRQRRARRIVEAVGADNARVQFDFYHCRVVEGDLARRLAEQLPPIGRSGHDGWVGAEYTPKAETTAGPGRFAAARGRRGPSPVAESLKVCFVRDGASWRGGAVKQQCPRAPPVATCSSMKPFIESGGETFIAPVPKPWMRWQ